MQQRSDYKYNPIQVNRDEPTRKLGMGSFNRNESKQDAKNRLVGFIQAAQKCPSYNLPVIDNVTIHYDGPLTDTAVNQSFGNVINPLGANPETPPPGAFQVDTTFAEPGKFQTFNLICGIQWRLDFEPLCFTVLGNSWTPANIQAAAAMPVSPSDFNVNAVHPDTVTGAAGANSPLGLVTNESMVQAALQWGWWADLAGYYMARGFNLQWQWGNRQLILNDQLRYTAFTPSNAQDGSASDSNVDVPFFVRRTNNYYQTQLSSLSLFLAADRSRIGNMTLGGNTGLSVFRPDRSNEFVGATYGGTALKQYLRGNSEFRRLSYPFLIKPGVPIGLKAVQSNTDDSNAMRQYLSWTNGFGGVGPANFTPSTAVLTGASIAGTPGITGAEPSLDTPVAPQSQQLNSNRVEYKGGGWKLTVAFKGFELTPDQAALLDQNPDIQSAIQSECGCACKTSA
jgi:hypothetical protein